MFAVCRPAPSWTPLRSFPLLPLVLIIISTVWVLLHARRLEREGRPVVVTVFGHTLENQTMGAALRLVLFMLVFPTYLVARHAST